MALSRREDSPSCQVYLLVRFELGMVQGCVLSGSYRYSALSFSMYQRKPPEGLRLGERLQGGFCPYTRPYPSRFWRLAPWRFFSLGCRGANFTPALDTLTGYDVSGDFGNSTEVPEVLLLGIAEAKPLRGEVHIGYLVRRPPDSRQ
jgi:hypothetical protein